MFPGHNLSRHTNPNSLSSLIPAGQGDVQTSNSVDLAENQGVLFLIQMGTIASGGNGTIKIQMSADDGVTDPYVDVAGSGQNFTNANSTHLFVVDINRPQRRWWRVAVVRGSGGNTSINGIIALEYNLEVAPNEAGLNTDGVVWLANPGPGAP